MAVARPMGGERFPLCELGAEADEEEVHPTTNIACSALAVKEICPRGNNKVVILYFLIS